MRAFAIVDLEFPGVASFTVHESDPFISGISDYIRANGDEATSEALEAVIVTVIELMDRLIGHDLTASLIDASLASATAEADRAVQGDVAGHLLMSAFRKDEEARMADAMHARMYDDAVLGKDRAELMSEGKSESMRNVSHELRTPLNAISGYVELLDSGVYGAVTEAQRGALDRVRQSQQYILVLINEILNFDLISGGSVRGAIEHVSLSEAMSYAVNLVAPMCEQKELTCKTSMVDEQLIARADPYRLRQILVNLLTNAVKFTGSGGRIIAACEATDIEIVITVTDTGEGIAEDKLDLIFAPFLQLHAGVPDKEKGFGLGLWISRDLARGMGGDLIVESKAGVGSCFTLTLPRAI